MGGGALAWKGETLGGGPTQNVQNEYPRLRRVKYWEGEAWQGRELGFYVRDPNSMHEMSELNDYN